MTSSRQIVERRKHKRFQVPKGLFAVLGSGYTKVGPVVDISMKGLAFRYINKREPSNGAHMDIFTIGGDFYLPKVPVKIISDVEVLAGTPSSSIAMRRCSVHFGELTSYQKAQVEQFIQDHAIGET